MENRVLKQITSLVCLLGLSPAFSHAGGLLVYGGLAAGYSVLDNPAPATASASEAGKVYIGMDLFGPFGVEGSYYNLGKYNAGTEQVTATNVSLVARAITSVGSLIAKGGAANWTVKDTTNSSEVSGNGFMYGVGYEMPIASRTVIRAEWERFKSIGKDTASSIKGNDISLLTFGINFLF